MTLKEKEIESVKNKSYNYYNCRDVKKAVLEFEKELELKLKDIYTPVVVITETQNIFRKHFGDFK